MLQILVREDHFANPVAAADDIVVGDADIVVGVAEGSTADNDPMTVAVLDYWIQNYWQLELPGKLLLERPWLLRCLFLESKSTPC